MDLDEPTDFLHEMDVDDDDGDAEEEENGFALDLLVEPSTVPPAAVPESLSSSGSTSDWTSAAALMSPRRAPREGDTTRSRCVAEGCESKAASRAIGTQEVYGTRRRGQALRLCSSCCQSYVLTARGIDWRPCTGCHQFKPASGFGTTRRCAKCQKNNTTTPKPRQRRHVARSQAVATTKEAVVFVRLDATDVPVEFYAPATFCIALTEQSVLPASAADVYLWKFFTSGSRQQLPLESAWEAAADTTNKLVQLSLLQPNIEEGRDWRCLDLSQYGDMQRAVWATWPGRQAPVFKDVEFRVKQPLPGDLVHQAALSIADQTASVMAISHPEHGSFTGTSAGSFPSSSTSYEFRSVDSWVALLYRSVLQLEQVCEALNLSLRSCVQLLRCPATGLTMLHLAAYFGQSELCNKLVKVGACWHQSCRYGTASLLLQSERVKQLECCSGKCAGCHDVHLAADWLQGLTGDQRQCVQVLHFGLSDEPVSATAPPPAPAPSVVPQVAPRAGVFLPAVQQALLAHVDSFYVELPDSDEAGMTVTTAKPGMLGQSSTLRAARQLLSQPEFLLIVFILTEMLTFPLRAWKSWNYDDPFTAAVGWCQLVISLLIAAAAFFQFEGLSVLAEPFNRRLRLIDHGIVIVNVLVDLIVVAVRTSPPIGIIQAFIDGFGFYACLLLWSVMRTSKSVDFIARDLQLVFCAMIAGTMLAYMHNIVQPGTQTALLLLQAITSLLGICQVAKRAVQASIRTPAITRQACGDEPTAGGLSYIFGFWSHRLVSDKLRIGLHASTSCFAIVITFLKAEWPENVTMLWCEMLWFACVVWYLSYEVGQCTNRSRQVERVVMFLYMAITFVASFDCASAHDSSISDKFTCWLACCADILCYNCLTWFWRVLVDSTKPQPSTACWWYPVFLLLHGLLLVTVSRNALLILYAPHQQLLLQIYQAAAQLLVLLQALCIALEYMPARSLLP